MPHSITKRSLSFESINGMVQRAFGCHAEDIEELTEGFFNIAYKIQVNGRFVILKVAPPKDTVIMTYEKNIMFSEVDSMRLVCEVTEVPVPKVLFYDDSHTICNRTYFFMEMVQGHSFSSVMAQMSQRRKDDIFYEIGKYTRMLNQITNSKFGHYCQKERQCDNWYSVFRHMLADTFFDAARKNIMIPADKEQLLAMLESDKAIFDSVKSPKFVHWDIWAGNVFVNDEKITGIIDFERCLWADELMEVGFRTYSYEQAFFDGYGIKKLTDEQKRRAEWYDVYLFLISCLECDYRMYDNRETYRWGCEMLIKWVERLSK